MNSNLQDNIIMIIESKRTKKRLFLSWGILTLILIVGMPFSFYIGKAKGINDGFEGHLWKYLLIFFLAFTVAIYKIFIIKSINLDYTSRLVRILGFNSIGMEIEKDIQFKNLKIKRRVDKYEHVYILFDEKVKIKLSKLDFLDKDYVVLIAKLKEIENQNNFEP